MLEEFFLQIVAVIVDVGHKQVAVIGNLEVGFLSLANQIIVALLLLLELPDLLKFFLEHLAPLLNLRLYPLQVF